MGGRPCLAATNLLTTLVLGTGRSDKSGQWKKPIQVPTNPAIAGVTFTMQAFTGDKRGLQTTNGARCRIGK